MMTIRIPTMLGFVLFAALSPLNGQKPPALKKYWIEFSDKNNSPYCTCRPAEFLSARALERRARASIAIEENDLPVNPAYLDALRQGGAVVHNTSRWLNAATVIADSATAAGLRRLPFVRNIDYIGPHLRFRNPPDRPVKKRVPLSEIPRARGNGGQWGYAARQDNMLGLPLLHSAGARGEGIWVAVMDGGFTNADTITLFDSVALNHRLFQGHDFVERDGAVFEGAAHGTAVLSVMAGNLPGWFVGAAPDATYFLVKTEDTGGEFPVEEANWIAGAEWADSLGVDVINASLGYTSFNDTTLSHTYPQLDGRTAIGSRGAVIAASKGMIICNSAGNEGDGPWRHIGVPADAPGLIAVGAVGFDGKRAGFSSLGPSADGRIKPDLVAPGSPVVAAGDHGVELGYSSGTSLASPMLAGSIAALWSAFPAKTAREILDAVVEAADQSASPDNKRGYGLPDFSRAWLSLGGFQQGEHVNLAGEGLFAFDRAQGTLSFLIPVDIDGELQRVELRDGLGNIVPVNQFDWKKGRTSMLSISGLDAAAPGYYELILHTQGQAIHLYGLLFH